MRFVKDELILGIKEGNRKEVWGPVATINWKPQFVDENEGPTFEECYNFLLSHLRETIGITLEEYCFLYSHPTLHTTIATFAPANQELGLSEEEKKQIDEKIKQLFSTHQFSIPTFTIQISDIFISPNAGLFLYHANETVNNIREQFMQFLTNEANRDDPCVSTIMKFYKAPQNFIHSTFLRFSKLFDTEGGVSSETFKRLWDESVALFKLRVNDDNNEVYKTYRKLFECPVVVEKINIVCEVQPYMQRAITLCTIPLL